MKILNLVDESKSDVKYIISKFPDGQQNIIINKNVLQKDVDCEYIIQLKSPIQIKSRLNNWLDLEIITCAVASLRELGVKEIHLYTPYIMGARSDRKFEEGGNNYLKDVICPAINLLNLDSVTCIDPHSNCLEMGIKNFKKQDNYKLIDFALHSINKENSHNLNDLIFISPDAGASHKIYKLAKQIGYKGDIITCSKERDENGKLTKTVVPISDSIIKSKKDYIIIDDICDGGATFINIAKEIKATFNVYGKTEKPKIYLIVTHGIFSKGFEELAKYFDGIYCTNSYKDISGIEYNILHKPLYIDKFVKQLNVF